MAGGYSTTPTDPLDLLAAKLVEMKDRLAELERPTGTQLFKAVAELTQLVNDLPGQIYAVLAVAVNTGNVTATGSISANGSISAVGPIYTPHGRANPVTTGYIGAWLNSDGRIGASVSSVAYKQDFEAANTAEIVDAIMSMSLVRFRYIDAVEKLGDDAPSELGSIAEYLATTPLSEYVFNNSDGDPMGITYERLTIPLIAAVQSLNARLKATDAQIADLTKRLDELTA